MLPPPHKKIIKAKSATTIKVAPPCTITISIGPVIDFYICPGSGVVIYYAVAASCTKTGNNCDLVYVAARECANANFASNSQKARESAATQCPVD
jgi:hypothetical protein